MPLTPIDIQQKTFGPELRGYNMDEVDDFLDEVVATLKDYDQRVRDAQDRIRALEAEVATRGEDETAISRALVAAQKQADAVVEEAHQEAERIRAEAFDEADSLRSRRDAERMALTQDIARMRATVADLKRRVVELAASAEADLDAMDDAIADASDSVTAVPADESADEEMAVVSEPEESLDAWAGMPVETGEHEAGDWEEEVTAEPEPEPEWETPVGDREAYDQYGDEDEDEDKDEDEGLGDLADEMADEAAEAPAGDMDDTAPPSRRPWERGSV